VADGITTVLPVFFRNPGAAEISLLFRAIDSVLSQECDVPLEVLIVDDGSEPALAFERERVRVIRLARNRGISYALNAGLTQARYDLIARIDADDFWRPGKLAKQVAALQKDPDLTLVASGMRLVHPHTPEFDRDELRGGDWAYVLELSRRIGCPFPHGSILGRRSVFERLGGYPQGANFQHSEDFALWAQWIRFFKVAICDEVFLEYTVSENQISARFAREQERASVAAGRVLDVLKDRSRVPELVKELASALGMNLSSASNLFFNAWRFYDHVLAGPGEYDAAAMLFPDRAVHRIEEKDELAADRFFSLQRGSAT
jgi:glycosyltransferase involved in cell wall biosynthesis